MILALIGWLLLAVAGFGLALLASRRVATHATALVQATRLSPFFVGLVVLAVGTDIPEIVNSIVTSAADHGDLNVGNAIGSTLTQMTLVLGLLPFLGGWMVVARRGVLVIGGLTTVALLVGVILIGDGQFSRADAAVLVVGWVVGITLASRANVWPDPESPSDRSGGRFRHTIGTVFYLLVVTVGAIGSVAAMIEIAELLSVPEYVIAFFGASIGTSLPELIVDVTAIRRGAIGLALGDVMGSSLVDSTLSIGIGPLLFPTMVDGDAAVIGGLLTAAAVALVAMLLSVTRRHDRRTGLILILIYASAYLVVLD